MGEREGVSRRSFLKMAAAGAAGVSLAEASAASETPSKGGKALARVWTAGEPYELAGKRIVFTNWYWIRPGSFGWYDDKGESVAVKGSEGPWGAHFWQGRLEGGGCTSSSRRPWPTRPWPCGVTAEQPIPGLTDRTMWLMPWG